MISLISLICTLSIIVIIALFISVIIKRSLLIRKNIISFYFFKYLFNSTVLLLINTIIFANIDQFKLLYSASIFATFSTIIKILWIFNAGYLLLHLSKFFQEIILNIYSKKKYQDLTLRSIKTKIDVLGRILNILIFIIVGIAILLMFDKFRALGNALLTTAGIATLIIGFAAQKSLGSLFNGLQIAFTQPIKIDDNVIVGGRFGTISKINLTNVIIRTWDEKRLIVPINYFIENTVENWTQNSAEVIATVKIYCDYSVPFNAIRTYFNNEILKHPLWDRRSAACLITNCNEFNIEIRASLSVKNPEEAFIIECDVREKLIKFIYENYPQSFPNQRFQQIFPPSNRNER